MKAIVCTIIAGLFAIACSVILSVNGRYCYSRINAGSERVFDNWKGRIYSYKGGEWRCGFLPGYEPVKVEYEGFEEVQVK